MLIRSALAAIDFNANINRKTKVSADGKPRYKMKVGCLIFDKLLTIIVLKVDRTGSKVTIVEQKEPKDYSFMTNIFDLCVECLEMGVVPNPEVSECVNQIYFHKIWFFSIPLIKKPSEEGSMVLSRFLEILMFPNLSVHFRMN